MSPAAWRNDKFLFRLCRSGKTTVENERDMKRLIYILVSALLLACSGYEIIPDDRLALIFHDAFLSNAYLQQQGLRLDSMNVYEPIFAKYGYTTADVQYTIGNFSKRKSARLSDVVEQAIKLLEGEAERLDREVAILDTIDNVARRAFRRTLRRDSLVRVTRLQDTARLRFAFDDIRPGDYAIAFDYLIDSLDENTQLRSVVWFEQADGRRVNVSPTYLTRRRTAEYRREMKADTSVRRLVLDLYEIRNPQPKRPHMTVRNLRVDYTPDVAAAVDSLFLRQLNIKIFADDFCNPAPAADRVALAADSLGTAAPAAADAR